MRTLAATRVGVALLRPDGKPPRPTRQQAHRRRQFAGIVTGVPAVISPPGRKWGTARDGIPHPDGLALIASNWGGVKHPAWYHNLKANPEATVSVEGDIWHATARPATPRERDEIWAKGLELYPAWKNYEAWAGERHIEAVVLSRY